MCVCVHAVKRADADGKKRDFSGFRGENLSLCRRNSRVGHVAGSFPVVLPVDRLVFGRARRDKSTRTTTVGFFANDGGVRERLQFSSRGKTAVKRQGCQMGLNVFADLAKKTVLLLAGLIRYRADSLIRIS